MVVIIDDSIIMIRMHKNTLLRLILHLSLHQGANQNEAFYFRTTTSPRKKGWRH